VGKEWHRKTWLELFRTEPERAEMLLIPASLSPTVSNTEFKIPFSHLMLSVCA